MKISVWFVAIGTLGLCAYAGAEDKPANLLLLAQATQPAQGQAAPAAPTPQQRVAMLKQWLQASQAQLRAYEWIETTVIAMDGEEKKRQQNTCYYGADGRVQKIPIESGEESESGGPPTILPLGRMARRAAKRKQEEITEYMQSASALIHSYIPPDPNRIQQAIDAGTFAINMIEPGRRVRLEFGDYLKSGDMLSIDIELSTNRLLGLHVSSYLDTAEDPILLDVAMGVLPDGTIYSYKTSLAAPAEEITVTIENSGHRRAGA